MNFSLIEDLAPTYTSMIMYMEIEKLGITSGKEITNHMLNGKLGLLWSRRELKRKFLTLK